MKKCLAAIILLCLICLFAAGCSKNSIPADNQTDSADVSDFVDLTEMDGPMVFAEVWHMMQNRDDYIGKTVKIRGPFNTEYIDEIGRNRHCVVTQDEGGCCRQGFEFIWNGEHIYPNDYPEQGTIIEVTGVFESYEAAGIIYCYLSVNEIVVL